MRAGQKFWFRSVWRDCLWSKTTRARFGGLGCPDDIEFAAMSCSNESFKPILRDSRSQWAHPEPAPNFTLFAKNTHVFSDGYEQRSLVYVNMYVSLSQQFPAPFAQHAPWHEGAGSERLVYSDYQKGALAVRVIKIRNKDANKAKDATKTPTSASVREWDIFQKQGLVPDDLPKCFALCEMTIESVTFEVLVMERILGNLEDRMTWSIFNRVSKLRNI